MKQWRRMARQWTLTSMLLLVAASVWAGNVSPLIQDTGARVGIGTAGPYYALMHVENAATPLALFARSTAGSGSNYGLDVEATGVGAALNTAGFFYASGATANTGIEIAGPAAGAQNYALLSRTDAVSYFAGPMGLGTTSPAARLHVMGTNAAMRIEGSGMSSATMQIASNSTLRWTIGAPAASANLTLNNATGTAMMTLDQTGNMTVAGNLAAKYQDVAEWVPAARRYADGTVVVLDTARTNEVVEAQAPYDAKIAGVVSARPGVLLGEPGQNKVVVAHMGRVKVKVDAQYGAINVGDLLVTSATPGHAMRSTPVDVGGTAIHRPGTILGKALESLDAGRGEILVLVTLQ